MGNTTSFNSSSDVYLHNRTGGDLEWQVKHLYTGGNTQYSGWKTIKKDEKVFMLTAKYNTGFLTTGRSNWSIEARHPILGMVVGTNSTGAFSNWKAHTLAIDDKGKRCTIDVSGSTFEIISPSGKSTGTFNLSNAVWGATSYH